VDSPAGAASTSGPRNTLVVILKSTGYIKEAKTGKKIQTMCNKYQVLSRKNAFLYYIFRQPVNHLSTTCRNLLT
jgi:hypothetical protein